MEGRRVVAERHRDIPKICEVHFRLCAKTDPQRDSLFTKGPSDVLDHATDEIASGSKLGIDATKKLPGEGGAIVRRLGNTLKRTASEPTGCHSI